MTIGSPTGPGAAYAPGRPLSLMLSILITCLKAAPTSVNDYGARAASRLRGGRGRVVVGFWVGVLSQHD